MDQPTDENEYITRQSRIPTRRLGSTLTPSRRRTGLSHPLPQPPRVPMPYAGEAAVDAWEAQRATQRRRRLLAIFGRMMARFYDRHQRHWSMGRWDCAFCQRRIAAWAWAPVTAEITPDLVGAMHEDCVSRSMWEVVLHHEQVAQANGITMPDAEFFSGRPDTSHHPR